MSWQKICVLAFVLLSCGAVRTRAQHEFEVTPIFGTRFGGSIDFSQAGIPTLDYHKINSSEDYGIIGDYTFWTNFQGEFMWNRQPTTLSAHDPTTNTFSFVSNMNLDMYQFNIAYQFKSAENKLRPFATIGLGFSHWGTSNTIGGRSVLPFSNTFSYNLGGGVKYFFSDHVGVRAELRYSPSHTTTGIQEFCDPFFGCQLARVANKANQGQANIGIVFRFHK